MQVLTNVNPKNTLHLIIYYIKEKNVCFLFGRYQNSLYLCSGFKSILVFQQKIKRYEKDTTIIGRDCQHVGDQLR